MGLSLSLISGTRRVMYDDAADMMKWCKELLQLKSLVDSRVGQGSQRSTKQSGRRRGQTRAAAPTQPLAPEVLSASSGHLGHDGMGCGGALDGGGVFRPPKYGLVPRVT